MRKAFFIIYLREGGGFGRIDYFAKKFFDKQKRMHMDESFVDGSVHEVITNGKGTHLVSFRVRRNGSRDIKYLCKPGQWDWQGAGNLLPSVHQNVVVSFYNGKIIRVSPAYAESE